jgi:hypothetical protein
MRRWLRVEAPLPASHTRLPICSFENATEVCCKEKHPCKYDEDPEPLVPYSGLWSRSVSVRRQGLFFDFIHGRGDDGSR